MATVQLVTYVDTFASLDHVHSQMCCVGRNVGFKLYVPGPMLCHLLFSSRHHMLPGTTTTAVQLLRSHPRLGCEKRSELLLYICMSLLTITHQIQKNLSSRMWLMCSQHRASCCYHIGCIDRLLRQYLQYLFADSFT